jgi:transposase
MPQKLKVSGSATPSEVTAARQTHTNPHDQERLLAIGMAQQGGFPIADIAAAKGRGKATIGRWRRKFRSGGIPELLKRSHGARQAQLDAASQQALKAGLLQGKWKTAKEIRQWLEQEHGKQLSVSGVHYWLKKVKASL